MDTHCDPFYLLKIKLFLQSHLENIKNDKICVKMIKDEK